MQTNDKPPAYPQLAPSNAAPPAYSYGNYNQPQPANDGPASTGVSSYFDKPQQQVAITVPSHQPMQTNDPLQPMQPMQPMQPIQPTGPTQAAPDGTILTEQEMTSLVPNSS